MRHVNLVAFPVADLTKKRPGWQTFWPLGHPVHITELQINLRACGMEIMGNKRKYSVDKIIILLEDGALEGLLGRGPGGRCSPIKQIQHEHIFGSRSYHSRQLE